MRHHMTVVVSLVVSLALASSPSRGTTDPAAPFVELDWDTFRHYVAAHVWVADIDFRDGDVRGMHICAGFNAFREPDAVEHIGRANDVPGDPTLQAAAFALTFNTAEAREVGLDALELARSGPRYASLEGEARVDLVRAAMWDRVIEDASVEAAVRETALALEMLIERLADRGLIDATRKTEDPTAFFSGANLLLGAPEAVEAAIDHPEVAEAPDREAARTAFAERFTRALAERRIEAESDRDDYARNMAKTVEKMFASDGVIRLRWTDR